MRCNKVIVLTRFQKTTLRATDACQRYEVINGQCFSSGLRVDPRRFKLRVSETVFEVIAYRFPPLREGLAHHLSE